MATISIRGSTSTPIQRDITLWRGAVYSIVDTITSVNITGFTISFIVRPITGDPNEARITKSVGVGITLTTPAAGVLTITITASDTDFDAGTYYYSVSRTDSGYEAELTYGKLILKESQVLGTHESVTEP